MQLNEHRHSRFGLILLAAGASSRLGSPKQLVQFQGRSLLRHAAETAVASGASPVVVVLGAGAERLRGELDGLVLETVVNAEWEEGMSSSIRAGIASAVSQEVSAVLLMLCDQPHVTAEVLLDLMTSFERSGKPIAVSDYGEDAIGPPCIFSRTLFPDLRRLRGAQGARQIWKELPQTEVVRVEFRLGRVDIDTPEDVAQLRRAR